MAKELHKLDLYAILGVEETASEKEIVKGYRKRALKCHPDKNPDNPKAAELFHQLSEALEILTDAAARSAYDRSRKAKKESEARNQALDSKRKKFKEDLEARERAAEEKLKAEKTVAAEKNLQKEILRLRKEGSRLLEQEQARLREELKLNRPGVEEVPHETDSEVVRIKLRWKAAKDDLTNGGYDKHTLTNILSCYGQIDSLIVSEKRNGSAIVEFGPLGVSPAVVQESGLDTCPFTMVWLSGKPSSQGAGHHKPASPLHPPPSSQPDPGYRTANSYSGQSFPNGTSAGQQSLGPGVGQSGTDGHKDFESLVLMKMRQAEERKRLIAQMQKEEEEEGNG